MHNFRGVPPYSALSTQSEHKIESFERIKKLLSKKKAKLLLPEIVSIEFERNIKDLYPKSIEYFNKLKDSLKNAKVQNISLIEDEKKKLLKTIDDILEERQSKYDRMVIETRELFVAEHVERITLTPDIFIKAFIRCEKREKPFKKKDGTIKPEEDFLDSGSTMNDAIIAESIIEACKNCAENSDELIFCSDNIEDFATYDKKENKHNLHQDIKKTIKVKVIYYRSLPDMLEKEFKQTISPEGKKGIENAKSQYSRHLYLAHMLNKWNALKSQVNYMGTVKELQELQQNYDQIKKQNSSTSFKELLKQQVSLNEFQKQLTNTDILKQLQFWNELQNQGSLADLLKGISEEDEKENDPPDDSEKDSTDSEDK